MVLFHLGRTTGPSKGAVLSHRYAVRQAQLMIEHFGLRSDDVLYSPFPLFHLDASVMTVMPALVLGTTAALSAAASPRRASGPKCAPVPCDGLRLHGRHADDAAQATAARPTTRDRTGPAGLGVCPSRVRAPSSRSASASAWSGPTASTDAGVPIYQPLDEPRRPGSCGRAIPQYDYRRGRRRGPRGGGRCGSAELVVRPQQASSLSDGYYGQPEATLASRRNLWFHTGDLVRRDAEGYVYFVGRTTDSIRRRGENISAFRGPRRS